jgi:hypothetical protein
LKKLGGAASTRINSKVKNSKIHPMREVIAAALVPVPRFVERRNVGNCEGSDVIFGYLMADPFFPDFLGATVVCCSPWILGMIDISPFMFQDMGEAFFKIIFHGLLQRF